MNLEARGEYGMSNMEYRKGKILYFTDLRAWKQSHKLTLMTYSVTKSFPREEVYGITSQMRRASVSITSNIAEGFGRRGVKDKARFYIIARGSLIELHNQLITSRDLKYFSKETFTTLEKQLITCHKIINGLISSTRS